MIENIYSGENKETKDRGTGNMMFRMPKNIRQIGQADSSPQIYMEDYVMTYIRQLAMKDYGNYKIAVLLGQFVKSNGVKNIFISGAVEAYSIDAESESAFSNETWTNIYEDVKKYFDDVEIVGWYIAKPGLMLETTEMITKLHINNFAGQDKTLLMYDSIEKEEVFYVYDNGKLNKKQGYYIYYEKNEEMQNYMVENKKIPTEEESYDDRAIKEIRQVIELKKELKPVKEKGSAVNLLYGASTMLAVIVLVIGATMLNNYDQMKSMEKTLNVISDHVVGTDETNNLEENDLGAGGLETNNIEQTDNMLSDVIEVKRMSGDIEKIKEGTDASPKESDDTKKSKEKKETKNKEESIDKEGIPEAKKFKKQKETIPKSTVQKTAGKAVTKDITYYTIKEGDTLATISAKYYKSIYHVDEILKVNNIEDKNRIMIGQKIIIP